MSRSRLTALALALVLAPSCVRSNFAPPGCRGVDCGGHGSCLELQGGGALCACDPGFHTAAPLTCVADVDGPVESSPDAAAQDRAPAEGGAADGTADAAHDAGVEDVAAGDGPRADAVEDVGATDGPADASGDGPLDAAVDGAREDTAATDHPAEDLATVDSGGAGDAGLADGPPADATTADSGQGFDASGWVYLAGGTYTMGCSLGDPDCENKEEPPHSVTVAPFYLQRTEVTQAQYQAVMGSNPSSFSTCGASCPVESLSWSSARSYCAAIGARLPSEAEWEYANRAGSTTPFSCGTLVGCISSYAWSFANSDTGSGRQPHPVGTKLADAYGLRDMNGNVWEWIEDCYHADYTGAPSAGEVWAGGDCTYRIIRGLGYSNGERFMRVSYRYNQRPDDASSGIGVRCAHDPP